MSFQASRHGAEPAVPTMSGPSSVEANVEFGVPMTVVAETKRDGRERQLFGGQRERQVSGTAIEHSRTRCRPVADFHCDEWVAAKPTLTHTRPVTRRASGQAAAVELALVDRAGRCCGAARRPEPDLRSRETCNVPDPGELQGNMPPRLQGKKRARALPIVMTSAKFAWRGAAMWIGKTLSRSCGAPS